MKICFTCKKYQHLSRYCGLKLSVYVTSFGYACFGICKNKDSKRFNTQVHENFTCEKHIEKEIEKEIE